MKKIQTMIAAAVALAMISLTTNLSAESAQKQTKAIVRTVHGDVQYSIGGGWMPLKPNTELYAGAEIKTGSDSFADISVNGQTSVVRVTANTTMGIETMKRTGSGFDADTETMLNLKSGLILGSVKKISKDSHYEIRTPNGVAGVRGTDYAVQATLQPDGTYIVTFTSVTGELIVSALVNAQGVVVKVLNTGESWTPGGDVVQATQQLLDAYRAQIPNWQSGNITVPNPAPTPAPLPNGPPGQGNQGQGSNGSPQ